MMDNLQRVVCLLVFFAPFRGLVAECPVAAPGCKCEDDWKWHVINCERLGTITALPAFTEVETIYQSLKFRDATLRTLPNNSFRNLKVKKIRLTEMKIRNIEPLAFVGLEEMVVEVDFSMNELNSLEGFKTLTNLKKLDVSYNQLAHIAASDFAPYASTLQVLTLRYHKLTIADGAFASLKSLKELGLGSCHLVTLAPTVFSEGMALQRLDIHSNNFVTIPRETFSKLKNITDIYLTSNQITILPTHGFADLPKLRTVDLKFNIIRKNLPMLLDFGSLRGQRIEGNITKDMFVGLDSLTSIRFANNLITSVENLYTSLPSLNYMTIHDNPLHCDCAIAWMRYFIGFQGLSTICDSPKDFKDKGMQVGSFPAKGCPIPTTTPFPTTTRPINTGAKIKSTICVISLPLVAMFANIF